MKVKLEDVCINQSSNLIQRDIEYLSGDYPVFGAAGFIKNIDSYKQEKEYIAIVKDGAGVGRTMLLPAKSSVIGTLQYLLPKENIDIGYLNYALIKLNLAKYTSGATIPHIYFKDYKKEVFELPELDEQKKVVSTLDRVSNLLSLRHQQLEKLDLLVKSRFIEMFDNIETNRFKLDKLGWSDVFSTTTGKLDSNAMVENGKYPFFTCAKEAFKIDTYAFDCEALLLAGNNAAGVYDVKHYKGKFNAYQRTYVLQLKNSNWSYEFFKMQLEDKLAYLKERSIGSNTRYLTLKILQDIQFLIPSEAQQRKFGEFIQQVDKSKFVIKQSIEKLELLKSKLMQDYFG